MSLTVTATEAVHILRAHGMRIGVKSLIAGIEAGRYGFGTVINVGKTGRRTVEIFRGDLDKWIKERSGG